MGAEIPDNSIPLSTQGVYVITTDDEFPCKIGVTDSPALRLFDLQVGNWHRLKMTALYFPYKVAGHKLDFVTPRLNSVRVSALRFEKAVHSALKSLDLHLRGEWFGVSADEAAKVIEKVAGNDGYRLLSPERVIEIDPDLISRRADAEAAAELLTIATDALSVMRRG